MVFILLLHQLYNMFLSCVWMVVKEERRMEFAKKYDDAAAAKPRWWYPYLSGCIAFILCLPKESPESHSNNNGNSNSDSAGDGNTNSNSNNNNNNKPDKPPATADSETNISSIYQGCGAYVEGPTSAPFRDLEANYTLTSGTINKLSTTAVRVEGSSSSSDESVYLSSESTHSSVFDEPSELTENSADDNAYTGSDYEDSNDENTERSQDEAGSTDSYTPSDRNYDSTESGSVAEESVEISDD